MTDSDDIQPNQILKLDACGRVRSTPQQREVMLDAFEANGLSGPEFCRVHGVNYQTFATWRQKRRKQRGQNTDDAPSAARGRVAITLMEAALAEPAPAPTEGHLLMALPGGARVEVADAEQSRLLARLLAELARTQPGGEPC